MIVEYSKVRRKSARIDTAQNLDRAEPRILVFHHHWHLTTMVSTFPVDLFEEIFSAAQIHDLPFAEKAQVEENAELATAVSQVCRHWRGTALQFSALWTYVPCISSQPKRTAQLSENIKRANGQLLTLFLQFPGAYNRRDVTIVSKLAREHLGQVKCLSIDVVESDMDKFWFGFEGAQRSTRAIIDAHKAPYLRSLSFSAATSTRNYVVSNSPGYFRNGFRSLVNMRVSNMDTTFQSDIVQGLSAVSLDNVPSSGAVEFILAPSASTLTSLTLGQQVEREYNQPPPAIGSVVLPALHTLIISHDSTSMLQISAPHLKVLKLHDYSIQFIYIILECFEYLSFTDVEDLYVHLRDTHDYRLLDLDLDNMLSHMFLALPEVVHLRLDGPTHSYESLLTLWKNMMEDGSKNWPKLRHLTVGSENARESFVGALQEAGRGTVNVLVRSKKA